MTISLYDIFDRFCDYTDERLRWKEPRKSRTELIVTLFTDYMKGAEFDGPYKEYMSIDAIWRDPSLGYVVLAVEHENKGNVERFVKEEIAHLADLKSMNKIAITYPATGEETLILEAIQNEIQKRIIITSNSFGENYLIIFGFPTWHMKKRAIRWNGYFFNQAAKPGDNKERVVFQRSREPYSVPLSQKANSGTT